MITNSQRMRLCGISQQIKPIFQIGKDGITDKEIIDISIALDLHEIVKILIKGEEIDAKAFLNAICALTGAEPISANNNEVVIYRHSSGDIKHIEI